MYGRHHFVQLDTFRRNLIESKLFVFGLYSPRGSASDCTKVVGNLRTLEKSSNKAFKYHNDTDVYTACQIAMNIRQKNLPSLRCSLEVNFEHPSNPAVSSGAELAYFRFSPELAMAKLLRVSIQSRGCEIN